MILKSIVVLLASHIVGFSALAAVPTTSIKWSIGVRQSTGDKTYEGKDLEAFLKKPLELKDIDT
jgi:hypothetical protein